MANKKGNIQRVNDKLYLASYGKGNAVVVDFSRDGSKSREAVDYVQGIAKQTSKNYFRRGKNDKRLLDMHGLATGSPNKWQLLETKSSFVAGAGFRLFDRKVDGDREKLVPIFGNKDWDDWHDRLELDDYMEGACLQSSFAAELNVKLTLGKKGDKYFVESLEVIDNNDIRAVIPKSGKRIEAFWVSEEFGYKALLQENDVDVIPAFDPKRPTEYLVSIIHLIARKPGQKVYGLANWWGTEQWTEVANKVPVYYEAAFKNGFFVTHHVKFPDDYFEKDGLEDDADVEKLKEETLNEIVDTLSSVEEANKIVVTFSKVANDGKSTLKEVKIEPVENPINDEAFIRMFEAANLVQASGHGVPGKLAGVQLGSDQGTSGKEIAAEAAYMQDFLTVFDRERILKPLRIAAKIEGLFAGKHIGIQRIDSYVPGSTSKNDVSHPNN